MSNSPFNNTSKNDIYYVIESYEHMIFENEASALALKGFIPAAFGKKIHKLKNKSTMMTVDTQENIEIDSLANTPSHYLDDLKRLYNRYDGFIYNIVKNGCQIAKAYYIIPGQLQHL